MASDFENQISHYEGPQIDRFQGWTKKPMVQRSHCTTTTTVLHGPWNGTSWIVRIVVEYFVIPLSYPLAVIFVFRCCWKLLNEVSFRESKLLGLGGRWSDVKGYTTVNGLTVLLNKRKGWHVWWNHSSSLSNLFVSLSLLLAQRVDQSFEVESW